MILTTLEVWAQHGPLFALIGVLLTIAALGWDGALRALTLPDPQPSQFVFQPKVIAPALLLSILLVSGGGVVVIAALTAQGWVVIAAPLLLLLVGRVTLAGAHWRYRRRLHAQLLLAVEQLAALTSGSAAMLSAFRHDRRSGDDGDAPDSGDLGKPGGRRSGAYHSNHPRDLYLATGDCTGAVADV